MTWHEWVAWGLAVVSPILNVWQWCAAKKERKLWTAPSVSAGLGPADADGQVPLQVVNAGSTPARNIEYQLLVELRRPWPGAQGSLVAAGTVDQLAGGERCRVAMSGDLTIHGLVHHGYQPFLAEGFVMWEDLASKRYRARLAGAQEKWVYDSV